MVTIGGFHYIYIRTFLRTQTNNDCVCEREGILFSCCLTLCLLLWFLLLILLNDLSECSHYLVRSISNKHCLLTLFFYI